MPAPVDLGGRPHGWAAVPACTQNALESAWNCNVPALASAIHARWWQFETWLRSLVYVELRSAFGIEWLDILKRNQSAANRAAMEQQFAYMASADANLILSYVDVSVLFDLISSDWQLFKPALIDQQIWDARIRELKQVRHRIAHCRRPHRDDLTRIEQTLRDLEQGAFRSTASYNTCYDPDPKLNDPVVDAWRRGTHADADLIDHAERKGITFRLAYSRRPWTDWIADGSPITGTPGYLWHGLFYLRKRYIRLEDLWTNGDLDLHQTRAHFIYLSCDTISHVGISFPAVDDPKAITNDLGACLRAVLSASSLLSTSDNSEQLSALKWDVDPRVQILTPWTIVDETTVPITIFSAC